MPPRLLQRRVLRLALMLGLCGLAACGAPEPTPSTSAPVPTAPPTQTESLAPEVTRLVAEGNAAFAESRFVAPPGDNAMERYLSALQLDPSHLGAMEALVEVFPAATAAAERAIDVGDTAEAARIIALMQRASPESLAVRALRERLANRGRGTGTAPPADTIDAAE